MSNEKPSTKESLKAEALDKSKKPSSEDMEKEVGGFSDQGLPEPTRYNDWEVKGRCSDF